jgi:ATP adenylyltransferase C-terminal domain/Ap4A phosphorylase N-terminal domain
MEVVSLLFCSLLSRPFVLFACPLGSLGFSFNASVISFHRLRPSLSRSVSSIGGLGFFNCCPESGSSQPRKHSQFVPFDAIRNSKGGEVLSAYLASHGGIRQNETGEAGKNVWTPLDAAVRQYQKDHHFRFASSSNLASLASAGGAAGSNESGSTGSTGNLKPKSGLHAGDTFTLPPFKGLKHAVSMLGGDIRNQKGKMAAETLHGLYKKVLGAAMGHKDDGGVDMKHPPPHNVLLTPTYILVVLRSQDKWLPNGQEHKEQGTEGSVPVNALAYSGFLLAKDEKTREAIEKHGPLDVLRRCGVVASSTS